MLSLKSLVVLLMLMTMLLSLTTDKFAQPLKKNRTSDLSAKEPVAVDAIAGILKLFDTRPLVALDEGEHHTAQTHAFFRALVSDPRFPGKVNDIVVECGSSKYQDVMDRYTNGDNVPIEQLQMVWRDTTVPYAFDNPVYRQFFETVRNVNLKLPKGRKLRILLGDPPLDWTKVTSFADWKRGDTTAAQITEQEVLEKGRKAIIIYGGVHLVRRDVYRNYEPTPELFAGIVEIIERHHPNSTYIVWANSSNDDLGVSESHKVLFPIPSLIMLKGTSIGARDFTSVIPKEGWGDHRIKFVNGKPMDVPKEEFVKFKLEDNVDALLYLGPVKYLYKTPYFIDTYADEDYYRESVRRSKILNEISLEDIEELRKKYLVDKKH